MKTSIFLAAITSLTLVSNVTASQLDDAEIKKVVMQALPKTKVSSIKPSEINGLIEVVAGNNVLYLDESGRYMVIGSIYDLKTSTDVSAKRRADVLSLNKVMPDDIPENYSTLRTHGTPSLSVIFDPLCQYCRKLYSVLSKLNNIAVKYVMVAENSQSTNVIANIQCNDNPEEAINDFYQRKPLVKASNECAKKVGLAIAENKRFAKANSLRGTPILIRNDGTIKLGTMNKKPLLAWLGEGKDQIARVNQRP